jgi:hypothetical protein
MYDPVLTSITCPLCRRDTEIEEISSLTSDVEFVRLLAERKALVENNAQQEVEIIHLKLQVADLQRSATLCLETHGFPPFMENSRAEASFNFDDPGERPSYSTSRQVGSTSRIDDYNQPSTSQGSGKFTHSTSRQTGSTSRIDDYDQPSTSRGSGKISKGKELKKRKYLQKSNDNKSQLSEMYFIRLSIDIV